MYPSPVILTINIRTVSRHVRSPISRLQHMTCTIIEVPPIEHSNLGIYGPWILEIVCLPVHVYKPDTNGDETRQTDYIFSVTNSPMEMLTDICKVKSLPDIHGTFGTLLNCPCTINNNPNCIAISEMLCP